MFRRKFDRDLNGFAGGNLDLGYLLHRWNFHRGFNSFTGCNLDLFQFWFQREFYRRFDSLSGRILDLLYLWFRRQLRRRLNRGIACSHVLTLESCFQFLKRRQIVRGFDFA